MNSPLDADAVLRDDALLDALGRGELPEAFTDDSTARLLLAWQEDVRDQAVTPIRVALPGPRVLWLSRRVTVAAAIGVFAASSLGSVAAASIAEPGDTLWPITKVVYTERAESMEARVDALATLGRARVAVAQHRPDQAKKLLEQAKHQADLVREDDDRAAITVELAKVQASLEGEPQPAPPEQAAEPVAPTPVPVPSQVPASPPPSAEPSPQAAAPEEPEQPAPSTQPSAEPEPNSAMSSDGPVAPAG